MHITVILGLLSSFKSFPHFFSIYYNLTSKTETAVYYFCCSFPSADWQKSANTAAAAKTMCLLNWRPFIFVKCWGPQIFLPSSSSPSHFAISPVSFVRFRSAAAAAFDVLLLFPSSVFLLVCLLVLNWRDSVCKLTQTDKNLRLLGCSKLTGWLAGTFRASSADGLTSAAFILLKERNGKEWAVNRVPEREGREWWSWRMLTLFFSS